MSYYPEIVNWRVPTDLLSVAVMEMSQDGERGNEGTCLWLGNRAAGVAAITHAVLLRGPNIRKQPANIQIEPDLIREVHCAAQELGLVLIGQIHSHGRHYGVDLSPVDHAFGFRVPYFLSVVAPDYGMTWPISWLACGLHVFERGEGFVRLAAQDVQQRIIETNDRVIVLTVGDDEQF